MENLEPIELEIAMKADEAIVDSGALDKNLKDLDNSVERTREKFKRYTQEQHKSTRAINANKKAIDAQKNSLNQVDKAIDKTRVTAQRAKHRYDALGNSVNQITRELPAFTYNAQTGFMAISNNIPILADSIARLRQENQALIASGQKATPVWRQLVGSLFSWNTALSLGITLITVYGREIGNWLGELIKGKSSVDALKKSIEALNTAFSSSTYKKASKSIISLKAQFDSARKGILDKERALKSYNETVGKVMGRVDSFAAAEKKLINQGDAYVRMMLYKSAALASLDKTNEQIIELEKKKLELENSKQAKDESSSYARLFINKRQNKGIKEANAKIKELEKSSLSVYNNIMNKAKAIAEQFQFDLFGDDKLKGGSKKTENEYKRLLERIAELDKEYGKPTFDKNEKEIQALQDKFEKIRNLIKEFNANPENKVKISLAGLDSLQNKAEKTLRYRQETDELKDELKKQKQLFAEYEEYKTQVGVEEADKRFQSELKGFNSYKDMISKLLEITKKEGDSNEPAVQARIRELQTLLLTAEQEEQKKQRNRFADLLNEYKGFNQKRIDLNIAYYDDIAVLEAQRNASNAQMVDAAIANRRAKYQEDVNNLQTTILQSSKFYERLFSDLSKKGYRTLRNFAKEVEEVLSSAETYNTTDGKTMVRIEFDQINEQGEVVKRVSNITVREFERIKAKSNELYNELQSRNPFSAIVSSFGDLLDALDSGDEDKMAEAINRLGESAKSSVAIFREWGNALSDIFGAGVGEAVDNIADLANGVVDLGVGIGSIATGDIVGGVSGVLSGISAITKKLTGWREKAHEQQIKMMLADVEWMRNIRQRNNELQKSVRYLSAYANEQRLLNRLIEKGIIAQDGMKNKYLHDKKRLKELAKLQKKEVSVGDELLKKLSKERFSASVKTGSASSESISGVVGQSMDKMRNFFSRMDGGLPREAVKMLDQVSSKKEWIELLNEKGWLTGGAKELYEAWKKSGKALEEYEKEYRNLVEETRTAVMGENFDAFVNSYADALFRMKGDTAQFADFTEEKIKSALLSSFKYQFLASQLKPLYEEMSEMLKGGIDNLNEDKIEDLEKRFKTVFKTSSQQLDKLSKAMGVDITGGQKGTESSNSLKGAVKGITAEQADLLAGQFGGLRITQLETNRLLKSGFAEMGTQTSRMVAVQLRIEANTKRTAENTEELKPIRAILKSIETAFKGDKLKGNGIKR